MHNLRKPPMLRCKRSQDKTMRCTSVKKNFCGNRVNWKVTHDHFWRILCLSCIHHIDLGVLGVMLDHSCTCRSVRRRRGKTPLVETLVGIVTLLLALVARDLWKRTVRRSTRSWSLRRSLVLKAWVEWVGRSIATFALLLIRLMEWRRRQPELLLLNCHLSWRRRRSCIPDSLLRSIALELSSLLL